MAKVFEDFFMEQQGEMISLCLEFARAKVDKVYAYGSLEEKSTSFNAFFELDGQVKMPSKLASNPAYISEFLGLGIDDLEKIRGICKSYERPVPTQMKLVYDCKAGTLDAKYQYEPVCTGKTGVGCSTVIMAWYEEVKQSMQRQSEG